MLLKSVLKFCEVLAKKRSNAKSKVTHRAIDHLGEHVVIPRSVVNAKNRRRLKGV